MCIESVARFLYRVSDLMQPTDVASAKARYALAAERLTLAELDLRRAVRERADEQQRHPHHVG